MKRFTTRPEAHVEAPPAAVTPATLIAVEKFCPPIHRLAPEVAGITSDRIGTVVPSVTFPVVALKMSSEQADALGL